MVGGTLGDAVSGTVGDSVVEGAALGATLGDVDGYTEGLVLGFTFGDVDIDSVWLSARCCVRLFCR